MIILVLINTILFILLSFLHIYWGLGGNWGMDAVLPSFSENQKAFKPGFFAKMAIGAAMGAFALVTIGNLNIFREYIPLHYFKYAAIGIGALFALRAMGDFRYIGFFKKATGTLFAKNDTKYYSPLCVVIAVVSFLIAAL